MPKSQLALPSGSWWRVGPALGVPQSSTWAQVAAQTTDNPMAFGCNMGHRHGCRPCCQEGRGPNMAMDDSIGWTSLRPYVQASLIWQFLTMVLSWVPLRLHKTQTTMILFVPISLPCTCSYQWHPLTFFCPNGLADILENFFFTTKLVLWFFHDSLIESLQPIKSVTTYKEWVRNCTRRMFLPTETRLL